MPNPATALQTLTPIVQEAPIVDGEVSNLQATPRTFTDQLFVIVSEYSTTVPFGPCEWGAIHGRTLPAQGAKCRMTFDPETGVPIIVWWEGTQSEAGVVTLSGTPGKAIVTAPSVKPSTAIQLTVMGTPIAVAVKERKAGSFIIEATGASTAEVAWAVQ